MDRRAFVKSAIAVGGVLASSHGMAYAVQPWPTNVVPDPDVKRVLVMFKCHFDCGFVNTQAAVLRRYFTEFFPQAIRVANEMQQSKGKPYVWTTGSWLLYEYLEQAGAEERRQMEVAIANGHIAWHALPFNWQTELVDRSMIAGSLAFSQNLDRRFGHTTTGAKMSDVPGHTRGLIGPLAGQGVKFIDIGVNGASTPAEVPPMFLWKDSRGASLAVMYHHGYGGITRVPGSDLAIATIVRSDNSGPHKVAEIEKIYAKLAGLYPSAKIGAASLTEIANAVEPHTSHLPIVTQEIGDTWIYGIASDPLKISRYREISRLRQRWISQAKFRVGDATDLALLRRLLLAPEHTWGVDTKKWLDFQNYTPKDLAKMLDTKNYKTAQFSWEEKRKNIFDGIATLPASLRAEASIALRNLEAKEPTLRVGNHPAPKEIDTTHFKIGIDPVTGAIHRLRNKKTGKEWASANQPLALFSYQTLSQKDYARFIADYIITDAGWAKKDFGKPNIELYGAQSQDWLASLINLHVEKNSQGHRILAQLELRDEPAVQSGRAAFPQRIYLEIVLPHSEPTIHLNLSWFKKPATRLPEALWLTFKPIVSAEKGQWTMDKSGEPVSPLDVAVGGARHMHAFESGIRYTEGHDSLFLETVDAPLAALGDKTPLNGSKLQPNLAGGIHCNLLNNAWGTNYVMWYGEDMNFRFALHC